MTTLSAPAPHNRFPNAGAAGLARFALAFGALFFVLLWAYQSMQGGELYRFYLHEMVVKPGAVLIQLIEGNEGVRAVEHRLVWEGGRLSVLTGCDGADAMMLLIAALLASALPWRARLLGALLGVTLIYVLNQARIAALYFAFRHDRGLFELIHGILGPLAVICAVLLFLLAFRNRYDRAMAA